MHIQVKKYIGRNNANFEISRADNHILKKTNNYCSVRLKAQMLTWLSNIELSKKYNYIDTKSYKHMNVLKLN